MTAGRGAWTSVGHRHGGRFYAYASGTMADGLTPDRDINYLAVHLAVRAIQARALTFGATGFEPTGIFGPKTKDAVARMQRKLGVDDDGVVGPVTSRAMWRDYVTWFAALNSVPPEHIWGMTDLESGFDPGAVGSVTPDQGLCQINPTAHPDITREQAYDPKFALDYTCRRLSAARAQFSGKGSDLQRVCSIAQHNSPLAAQQWFEIGWVGENETIAKYVALVLKRAETYKETN